MAAQLWAALTVKLPQWSPNKIYINNVQQIMEAAVTELQIVKIVALLT